MEDFEATRQRHLSHALAIAPGLIQRLDWSAERITSERTDRLRSLLARAREDSPWHRKRLDGLDLERFEEASTR